LEQILEIVVRPVLSARGWTNASSASSNSSVIFGVFWSQYPYHLHLGGRPRGALDLPRYRNHTRLEHSITVATARSHGRRLSMMFLEFRGCARHTQTANFWTDFEQRITLCEVRPIDNSQLCNRQGNKRVAKRLWAYVKAERLHFRHLL